MIPDGVMKARIQRNHRELKSFPRKRSQSEATPTANITRARPYMMKGIEHHAHPGLKVAWRVFQPLHAPIETVGQPNASEVRYSQFEAISLIVLVGDDEPIIRRRRLRLFFPEALGGLHLRRLMLEHGTVENVSDEYLPGDQHGRERGSQTESRARQLLMHALP